MISYSSVISELFSGNEGGREARGLRSDRGHVTARPDCPAYSAWSYLSEGPGGELAMVWFTGAGRRPRSDLERARAYLDVRLPAHLLVLRYGRLLYTYGRREAPFGIRACLCKEGGRTWETDRKHVLHDDVPDAVSLLPDHIEYDPGRHIAGFAPSAAKPG